MQPPCEVSYPKLEPLQNKNYGKLKYFLFRYPRMTHSFVGCSSGCMYVDVDACVLVCIDMCTCGGVVVCVPVVV